MKNTITHTGITGGGVKVLHDAAGSVYMHWFAPAGMMFGVAPNTPELRRFVRRALRELERGAARQKQTKTKEGLTSF